MSQVPKISQSSVIGLTGGLATGKSNVSQILLKHHYSIVDADRITHQVQAKGTPGWQTIVTGFGDSILLPNGELNRRKLGRLVFNDHRRLRDLVRLIDPFIRSEVIRQINDLKRRGVRKIVLDAPTLFENGYQYLADRIVVVACEPRTQLARLIKRDRLPISAAVHRISSQWPLSVKMKLADVVINSEGTFDQTRQQIIRLIKNQRL